MQIITGHQSRAARRELSLSQATVAAETGLNRVYLSDWEGGHNGRFTDAQLRKLRQFYEAKIEEANDSGEEITLTFGEADPEPAQAKVETFTAKRFVLPVGDEVTSEVLDATLDTIATNDKRLVEIMPAIATREDGLFGSGEYTPETLQAYRESFTLGFANYLMIRALGGWPEIGLSATGLNIAGDSVLAVLIAECSASFERAGLPTMPQAQANAEQQTEAEA